MEKGENGWPSFRSDLCAALNAGIGKIQSKEKVASKIPEKGFDDENGEDERIIYAGLPFFTKALHAPDESWRQVSLDDLIRFFRHPARYLLQRRLGIGFQGTEEDLPADEPFVVDRSARRKLADPGFCRCIWKTSLPARSGKRRWRATSFRQDIWGRTA